jgi:hypothetical protein
MMQMFVYFDMSLRIRLKGWGVSENGLKEVRDKIDNGKHYQYAIAFISSFHAFTFEFLAYFRFQASDFSDRECFVKFSQVGLRKLFPGSSRWSGWRPVR